MNLRELFFNNSYAALDYKNSKMIESEFTDYKNIKKKNTIIDVVEYLMDNDYTLIGTGSAAEVYYKSGSKYVVKVSKPPLSSGRIDGYKEFINYVKNHQNNPHLPRIGTPRMIGKYYVVPVEKLKPVSKELETKLTDAFWTYYDHMPQKSKSRNDDDALMADILGKYYNFLGSDKLIKTMVDLNKSVDFLDSHGENFMMRGNTIVITDPWS